MINQKADVIIVGSGVAGLISALNLPEHTKIILITKKKLKDSNSYLAQGGICVQRDENDRDSFIEDTLRAGHYENNLKAVEILVEESQEAIKTLEHYGVDFQSENGEYLFTKEGGHSTNRILYCGDYTGKAIMDSLIKKVVEKSNIKIIEDCSMEDLLISKGCCYGIYAKKDNKNFLIKGESTILATGGIGGIYKNSTNYEHIQGDAIAIAENHKIALKDMSYIQIHPTSLYEEKNGRRFLISESVRGEGAVLLNHKKQRFTDELKPRDIVSKAIFEEMKKENVSFQWLNISLLENKIETRFPKISEYLKTIGINPHKEDIPIVPAQHYTMGGISVDLEGRTTVKRLFAAGEVACTGVHGKNRLASNSLLESVVFAKRVVENIVQSSKEKLNLNHFKIEYLSKNTKREIIFKGVKNDEFAKYKQCNY